MDQLARSALSRYGLHPRRLRRLAADVLRVDADDGRAYALRCRPRADRVFGDIPLELAWMAALRRETEIRPPEPVPGRGGALLQEVDDHDCVLFRWIPGPELAARLTPDNAHRLGALSARLHEHAATFRPPPTLPVRTLDGLVRGAEREILFDHDHGPLLPPARRATFEAVAERFRESVAALYADPAGRRVIHADLHHENVKIDRGRLRPLDFYEAIWGYPVQDVALTLYDLRFFADAGQHGYPALRDAFRRGYESRLAWPEQHPGQIDTLVAGRRLRAANWVLANETAAFAAEPAKVPDPAVLHPFFERLETEFRAVMDA